MKVESVFQALEDRLLDLYLYIRYFDMTDLEILGFGARVE